MEQGVDAVGNPATHQDEQPGDARPEEARSRVAEQRAETEIRDEVQHVAVQRECRQHAPPFTPLQEPRVDDARGAPALVEEVHDHGPGRRQAARPHSRTRRRARAGAVARRPAVNAAGDSRAGRREAHAPRARGVRVRPRGWRPSPWYAAHTECRWHPAGRRSRRIPWGASRASGGSGLREPSWVGQGLSG